MKKFGFNKKADGDDDTKRSGIFGRKKGAQDDENPYAQQPAEDPYANMTPYQQAKAGLPGGPRPGGIGLPSGPGTRNGYGSPPPPYSGGAPAPNRYGADKVGAPVGYGGSRYDDNANAYAANQALPSIRSSAAPSRGPGGYGGLGRTDSMSTDDTRDSRDTLFSGASDRYVPTTQSQYQPSGSANYNQPSQSTPSGAASDSHGEYGEARERTAEEQEEDQVQDMKNEIRQTKQESLATLDRTLQIAFAAEETAKNTLARLGAQSERLYTIERNLDLAANQNKIAEEKTKELKTLNRSMFAVHVANPFTSAKRNAQRDQQVLDNHRQERDTRQETRAEAYRSSQKMEDNFKKLAVANSTSGLRKPSAAEMSKYAFEEDEEDREMEEEHRKKEDILSVVSGNLNVLSYQISDAVESDSPRLNRLAMKSDAVDDGVRMNRDKLGRIR